MSKLNGALRIRILERDGYACVYCGRRPPEVTLQVDHVMPRVHGGRDEATNLVTACFDCNNGKRADLVTLPDTVVLAPLPTAPQPRAPAHRAGWNREAELRWPEGTDRLWISGTGRYALVMWCAMLAVDLCPSAAYATNTFGALRFSTCGHDCWHDHELVDLAVPQKLTPAAERLRGAKRMAHFRECPTCDQQTTHQGVLAAFARMEDRLLMATA